MKKIFDLATVISIMQLLLKDICGKGLSRMVCGHLNMMLARYCLYIHFNFFLLSFLAMFTCGTCNGYRGSMYLRTSIIVFSMILIVFSPHAIASMLQDIANTSRSTWLELKLPPFCNAQFTTS